MEILSGDNILFIPDSIQTKTEVIRYMINHSGLFRRKNSQVKYDLFYAVMEREKRGTTGLKKGIATPHFVTRHVDRLELIVGLSKNGIDYHALDYSLTYYIFMFFGKISEARDIVLSEFGELLADITKMIRAPVFFENVKECMSIEEVFTLFKMCLTDT